MRSLLLRRIALDCLHAGGCVLNIQPLRRMAEQTTLAYEVVNVSVPLEQRHSGLSGLRILHLSDLHADGICDRAVSLASILSELRLDLCVLTGDYVSTHKPDVSVACHVIDLIARATRPAVGHFAVMGNHDPACLVPLLEGLGISVLRNTSREVRWGGQPLVVAGVDDREFASGPDLDSALHLSKGMPFTLLLTHRPAEDVLLKAAAAGVSYVLCGHTHGGQICLRQGRPLFTNGVPTRRLVGGRWHFKGLSGYTSTGVGTSTLRLRINCPPEVVLHHLI